DPQIRWRFKREAQLMAAFEHPHAVRVNHARLTESDVAFIEMEFLRGKSLDKVFQRGVPMPLDWVARILVQLCDALQAAHEGIELDGERRTIIHRDLKPSNLMILDGRPEGQEYLKVLDFGIAKFLGRSRAAEDDPSTVTGAFIGTPPYTSPEQAE